MQNNQAPLITNYYTKSAPSQHAEPKTHLQSAPAPIGAQPFFVPQVATPIVTNNQAQTDAAEAHGLLASVQLPVGIATPTLAAWCSVSNLVAVALTPEPGNSTAKILILDPSIPEDCTALELPVSGPGDVISSLEWSWPGQRRALLCATSSGRVVVWTQPSLQGQDDAVHPRCIDDWHGQLLMDAAATAGGGGGGGVSYTNGEQGGGLGPAPLAAVCWLRQPPGPRAWVSSDLARKQLEVAGDGGEAAGSRGGQERLPESLESLFACKGPLTGAVPHWARPHQLTAAVVAADGGLTFLWSLASKLPNTLSWYSSKTVRLPGPSAAIAAAAGEGADGAGSGEWRIVSASVAAVDDGSLTVAAVYDRRRDAVLMYGVRGNPTLSGTPVSVAAAAVGSSAQLGGLGGANGGGAGAPAGTAVAGTTGTAAAATTAMLTATLALPQGLTVQQCRLHVSGCASTRAFLLAQHPHPHPYPHHPHPYPHPHAHHTAVASPVTMRVLCYSYGGGSDEQQQQQEFTQDGASGGGGARWRMDARSPQLRVQPRPGLGGGGVGVAGGGAVGVGGGGSGGGCWCLGVSVCGSKVAVAGGGRVWCLEGEALGLLREQRPEHLLSAGGPNYHVALQSNMPYDMPYGNGHVTPPPALSPPLSSTSPSPLPALVATACLSPTSCCLCTVAAVVRQRRQATVRQGAVRHGHGSTNGGDGDGAMEVDGSDWRAAEQEVSEGLEDEDAEGGMEEGLEGAGEGAGASGVLLRICTVPDVVQPASASSASAAGGGAAVYASTAVADHWDSRRLAWGLLHRMSLWDVAERLRCAWLAGCQHHVSRTLDELDGLLYGEEEVAVRGALAAGISRAKLEVLRRLPSPAASLLAADLLTWARAVQYSNTLTLYFNTQADALSHDETRSMLSNMMWFLLEVLTLMLAGVKLWAEGGQQEQGAAGGAVGDLPLVRLFADHNLHKLIQLPLCGMLSSGTSSKQPGGGPQHDPRALALQELLGGPEVATRARLLLHAVTFLQKTAQKHLMGALQPGSEPASVGPGCGTPLPPAALASLSAQEVEQVTNNGELPRPLMHRTLAATFPGPFHMHYGRTKGLISAAALAQAFRSDDLARRLALLALPSRSALMERHRALELTAQLLDRRQAPAAAARRLWMSFRSSAPPPGLHGQVLFAPVSARQRQRWRRQRGAALALASSAPLWSHAQGAPVDCLTGVPLPPGTAWALEGASAVGAVTAQMGPGLGAAGVRPGLPPLLCAVHRAWVGCAAPAELGSGWKRARLGLEGEMEY